MDPVTVSSTSTIIEDYKRLLAESERKSAARDEAFEALRQKSEANERLLQALERAADAGPKAQKVTEALGHDVVSKLDESLANAKTPADILKALNEAINAGAENATKHLGIEGAPGKQYHISARSVFWGGLGAALGLGGVVLATAYYAKKAGHAQGVHDVVQSKLEYAMHEGGHGLDMRMESPEGIEIRTRITDPQGVSAALTEDATAGRLEVA